MLKQVQLFFIEICKKDNKAIYNLLPDLIQKMSKSEDYQIFSIFASNVLTRIDKDKNSEIFVNKVCQRFEVLKNDSSEAA